MYIADAGNYRVRKVSSNGIVTTFAGNGSPAGLSGKPATNAVLSTINGMALDASGNVYLSLGNNSRANHQVSKVVTNGIITTVAGKGTTGFSGDGGLATNASLTFPLGLTLDASGTLYIADSQNFRIRKVPLGGPSFALTSVSTNDAGDYSVIVTSPHGSVTSQVATLTVTIPRTPPQISAHDTHFGFLTNQFGFNLNGLSGQAIAIDASTNLVDWTALFTNTASGSPVYFLDPASTNLPRRFYRARLP